jgi:prepilin-type N-terminal cleavage/methylation domain-containing protein
MNSMGYGRKHGQRGFTMLETLMVVVMSAVLISVTVFQFRPSMQMYKVRAATDQLKSILRQGRESAVSQRRTVVVTFTGNNTVNLFQVLEPSNAVAATPFLSVPLQADTQFGTLAITPAVPDTPDGYGLPATTGIEFGNVVGGPTTGMQFQSDGTFTDGTGNPINGTVFIAAPNVLTTAGAVTVLGSTGRVRHYYYNKSNGWFK